MIDPLAFVRRRRLLRAGARALRARLDHNLVEVGPPMGVVYSDTMQHVVEVSLHLATGDTPAARRTDFLNRIDYAADVIADYVNGKPPAESHWLYACLQGTRVPTFYKTPTWRTRQLAAEIEEREKA